MIKNKKGISPLIATVLLIGFAVALAAVVMTWGLDFIKQTEQKTEEQTTHTLICASELSFEISDAECYDSNAETGGSISIDNRGQIDIVSLIIRIHNDLGVVTLDTLEVFDPSVAGVGKFEIKKFENNETKDALTNGAKLIEVVATVSGGEGKEDITCPQNIEEHYITPPCV